MADFQIFESRAEIRAMYGKQTEGDKKRAIRLKDRRMNEKGESTARTRQCLPII